MTQSDPEWYAAMAKALKVRDHAIKMINRWQQQLDDAEHKVQELSAEQGVTEQAPVQYEPIEQV